MAKRGKQSKREAPHTSEAMKPGKELMVVALAKGMGPGDAAEALGLGRSTVYLWKREDAEFSTKWEEAVEISLDRLETVAYNLALGTGLRPSPAGKVSPNSWGCSSTRSDDSRRPGDEPVLAFLPASPCVLAGTRSDSWCLVERSGLVFVAVAAIIFSFVIGIASRKVCIGV